MQLTSGYELAYSQDSSTTEEFNTGFYAARASHWTIDLFKRAAKTAIDGNCAVGDQLYMAEWVL